MITNTIRTKEHASLEVRSEGTGRPWYDSFGQEWIQSDRDGWRIALPAMKTIAGEWSNYRRLVLPAQISEVQLSETRRAFYAAWQSAIVACETIGEDDVAEDTGVAWFESRRWEASLFAHDVADGRA